MISIAKYLHRSASRRAVPSTMESVEEPQAANTDRDALFYLARRLLEGMERYCTQGDHAEFQRFQAKVRSLKLMLDEAVSAADVIALEREARQAVEEHYEGTIRFTQDQSAEFQSIISMLNQTLVAVSAGAQRSAGKLQSIEKQLEKASMIEDLVAIRSHLQVCLTSLREEAARQREDASGLVRGMEDELHKAQQRIALAKTGLPGRAECIQRITEAFDRGRRSYAAIFAIDRFRSINSRFGAAAGEEVVRFFAEQVVRKLPGGGQDLFRWAMGAVLALVDWEQEGDLLRAEIKRLASAPLDKRIQVGNRSALLTISCNWIALPVFEAVAAETLIDQLDSFVAEQD